MRMKGTHHNLVKFELIPGMPIDENMVEKHFYDPFTS
jgi:hypothetical protein